MDKFRNVFTDEFIDKPEDEKVHWRISVYVIVVNEKDEALLIKDGRVETWEVPGGGIDLGETLEEGGIRETKEETGYSVRVTQPAPLWYRNDFLYRPHDKMYCQSLSFILKGELVSEEQEELQLDSEDEITDVRWVPLDEIPSLKLGIAHESFLKNIKEYL